MDQKTPNASELVRVRDAWNGWRTTEVPLSQLHDVCWVRPTGAPHTMLHAMVMCSDPAFGTRLPAHESGRLAHQVQVCVVKCDVTASVYEQLARQASMSQHYSLHSATTGSAQTARRPGL